MSAERETQSTDNPARPASRFALFTDTTVRALLASAFVFIACCLDRNYQTDLWHHLARGRVLAEESIALGEFDKDRFTFTVPGQPFRDVNWLTQLFFFRVWQGGGLELLQIVNALLLAGMMGLLVLLSYRLCRNMAVAGGVGVFTFVGLWQLFLIRPQTLSLLLFVSLYYVLEAARDEPTLLRLAPLHLALWVNMHGAFPIGLVLIGCYGLAAFLEGAWKDRWGVVRDGRVWRLAGCLILSGLATLLNPYGWGVYEYVRQTSGLAGARRIDEWLPPGLNTLPGIAWALSLAALVVLLLIPGRRLNLRQVILLAVFLIPAARSVRMVAWWLIVIAPILASLIAARLPVAKEKREQRGVGATLTCLALLAGMFLSLPWFEHWGPFRLVKPTHRLEYDLEEVSRRLRSEARSGRIFTRFEWAEYLTWSLGPDFKVFMDGRIEIIPDDIWEDYALITSGDPTWAKLLDARYRVDYLLIDLGPYHGRLRPLVQAEPRWEQIGDAVGPVLLYRRGTDQKN